MDCAEPQRGRSAALAKALLLYAFFRLARLRPFKSIDNPLASLSPRRILNFQSNLKIAQLNEPL
jgi:hypothetical protein